MIFMNFKLCSILMIILIISITPSSASLTPGYFKENGNTASKSVMGDELKVSSTLSSVDDLDHDFDELYGVISSLNQNVTYVKKRLGDFGWKFWEWPGITNDIKKSLSTTNDIVNRSNNIIHRLEDHDSSLEKLLEDSNISPSDDSSYINNVNNKFCQKDAKSMASELSKKFKTSFTVRNVSTSKLHEGDIVQYLSQGKYPRYLKVQKILPSNSSSTKKLLSTTPIDVPIGYLECTGDKLVEIPLIGNVICLNRPDTVKVCDILDTAVTVQENGISKKKKDLKYVEGVAKKANDIEALVLPISVTLLGITVVSGIIAIVFLGVTPPAWVAEVVMVSAISFEVFISLVWAVSKEINNKYSAKANKIREEIKSCEADLNTYTKTETKNEPLSMNVTTFNGIPIIKHPSIPNWKELQFILIEKPLHGDLLSGPGLQFLYSPYEGYTGSDTFKFQYTDKYGKINGNMTVKVQINPIPVFTLEKNETTTKPDINNQNKEYNQIPNEAKTDLLTVFDEASNTELTNEQDKYLTKHQNRIVNKAETILYNLQNFLNLLLKGEYDINDETNPRQRKPLENKEDKDVDKFTKDAIEKSNYLNSKKGVGLENTSTKNQVVRIDCTYDELSEGIRKGSYNKDKVIVQVKDGEYIRYMQLLNITATNIQLRSGEILTPEEFKNQYVWKTEGNYNNHDYRFNILLVPEGHPAQKVLWCVYDKQKGKITDRKSNLEIGRWVCTIFAPACGIAVAVAGAYRLCDYCNSHSRQIITEIIENPEETTQLLQPNGVIKTYTRITQEVHNNQYCNKCTTAISIVICGTLILIGSIIGYILCTSAIRTCEKELDNLNKYSP